MNVHRLPLGAANLDPAFIHCLAYAIAKPELVQQFCRLYGSKLNTSDHTDDDMREFAKFVHHCIYLPLSDEAIHSLRSASLSKEPTHG